MIKSVWKYRGQSSNLLERFSLLHDPGLAHPCHAKVTDR
nr:MAG TPA_asm: hypothetical protein [Caudoviricetes sp.]